MNINCKVTDEEKVIMRFRSRPIFAIALLTAIILSMMPMRGVSGGAVLEAASNDALTLLAASAEYMPDKVRVGLIFNNPLVNSISLSSAGGMEIGSYIEGTFRQLSLVQAEETVIAGSDAAGLSILRSDGTTLIPYTDTIMPIVFRSITGTEQVVKAGASRYRGEIEIRKLMGNFTVVNIIDPEKYLYGVVPMEIGSAPPAEAGKAQAVAARNFLVANLGKHSLYGFDVCSSDDCQGYKGYDREYPATNLAVEQTAGVLALYGGKIAMTTYFSTSGGHTENSENVWFEAVPYLRGVPDTYEPETVRYASWTVTLTPDDIKVRTKGAIGDITGMKATKLSECGRVIELLITGTQGSLTYSKEACRNILGVRSQYYTIGYEGTSDNSQPGDISSQPSQTVTETATATTTATALTAATTAGAGSESDEGAPGPTAINVSAYLPMTQIYAISDPMSYPVSISLQDSCIISSGGVVRVTSYPESLHVAGAEGLTAYISGYSEGETVITEEPADSSAIAGTGDGEADSGTLPSGGTPLYYVINGRGYGHGVGMSQEGAMGMARAGFSYDAILKHYYTGIELYTPMPSAANQQ
ncbi:MAG: SpoIID/LytB domain-containing protein [Eubacteriales bacterium]|nr:SpoIID/LytB domain-containing protein [Eubacteriales bacterium]